MVSGDLGVVQQDSFLGIDAGAAASDKNLINDF